MSPDRFSALRRRGFLKAAGAATVFSGLTNVLQAAPRRVAIAVDQSDCFSSDAPVGWATGKLRDALAAKGVQVNAAESAQAVTGCDACVVVAGPHTQWARGFAGSGPLEGQERLRLAPGHLNGVPGVLVSGSDTRGYVYGVLELAERVQFGTDVAAALHLAGASEDKPANEYRSIARSFCSDIEDKGWYYSKDFWRGYLDVIAASRFNRFSFAYGFGYDFPRGVTGDYFHFPYPYLVKVPGYDVRPVRLTKSTTDEPMGPLSDAERDRNFEMLQFMVAETAARGMQFQLGIWTHAYQWTDSPRADHRIEGLTPENHAAYCRDALAILLKTCPAIQGVTMRVHGESGIPEGSYDFWRTLFEAITNCGRKVEIDMHAKGVNQIMIDMAKATGMPVKLGAKYSAEHQSLGYNQADIRELEIPSADRMESGTFNVSNGERRFTRYGYADFLKEPSDFKVWFRLWPGTQRHLLSADPAMAAAYGRTSSFCGAVGIDLCEPLTFKGREGSGQPGGRCAYADASLNPKEDWQKFEYYYRVWGRCLYNPDADPESWRRYLRTNLGEGATGAETALANASRITPLWTSAHLPSASNHSFWTELYTNMPIVVEPDEKTPYSDTPKPRCFGTVSPLDPQLFSTIVEHAGDLLAGRASPKYSPIEVAQWMADYSNAAGQALSSARAKAKGKTSPEFRRIEEDVLIQIGLGQFCAAKLRSGVLYTIYQQSGDAQAGKLAIDQYQKACNAWAAMAQRAQKVYVADVAYGSTPMRRGHWTDRLPEIESDLAKMRAAVSSKSGVVSSVASGHTVKAAVTAAVGKPMRPSVPCKHTPEPAFDAGKELALNLSLGTAAASDMPNAVLFYRHVNQGERWRSEPMQRAHNAFGATISAEYTKSPYALEYYFELRRGDKEAWFYPAFNGTLSNQPYFAVTKRSAM